MQTASFVSLVLLFVFPISGSGQETSSKSDLTHIYNSDQKKFSSFISSFELRKTGSDIGVLKSLFHKSHRQFLKKYKPYSQLKDIFQDGTFDCLSGTYFLSLALDHLGIKYRVIETNYHIFLIAQAKHKEVLLESTDRYFGFITNAKAIEDRIASYRQKELVAPNQLYLSGLQMLHELLPNQLPGLLYFNEAVEAFHKNDLVSCCKYLEEAWKIYDNPRIEGFTPILIHAIATSRLDEIQKEKLVGILSDHQLQAMHSLASR
jgi:hypothetical protein